MKAIIKGQVVEVGATDYQGKSYPFMKLLMDGTSGKELVRVAGNGKKVGETFEGAVDIRTGDRGQLKVKAL